MNYIVVDLSNVAAYLVAIQKPPKNLGRITVNKKTVSKGVVFEIGYLSLFARFLPRREGATQIVGAFS